MSELSKETRAASASRRGGSRLAAFSVLALLALSGAIVGGFFGTVFQPLDSLAHFRTHLSVVAALLALAVLLASLRRPALSRARLPALMALTIAALGGWSVAPFLLPPHASEGALPDRPVYSLLHMNLLYNAARTQPAVDRIRALRPDIATLVEVEGEWPAVMETLKDEYPFQFGCAREARGEQRLIGGDWILSRHPFADSDAQAVCRPNDGFALRRVDLDGVSISVVAQHLKWPWPRDQWYQIASLAPLWRDVPRPLLIGGDFNAVPWSAAVRTYASDSDTRPVGGIGSSWLFSGFPDVLRRFAGLPIDNILVSSEVGIVSVEKPEATASDHLPVLLRFMLTTRPPGQTDQQSVEVR